MPWSTEVKENDNVAESAASGIQSINLNSKPMGGMGRGRPALKNVNPGSEGISPTSTTATSPSSFSFKLSATQPASAANNAGLTNGTSGGFGAPASFGSSFGTLGAPSTTSGQNSNFGSNALAQTGNPVVNTDLFEEDEKPITKEEESMLNKIVHDKLVQIKKLNIDLKNCNRSDLSPNSPLFSLRTFEELRLRKELLQGISSLGYLYPSKIQEATLPLLLADPPQNIIAQSQSGTGKTASFVLTMLSRVDPSQHHPQCVCLAPTYELALQIGKIVETMGKYCPDIKITYAIRGHRKIGRAENIAEHIIIGTPGTALDWMTKYKCFDPKAVKVFVLDEADVMISQQGHQDQSVRMHRELDPECQCLFFSATYDDEVMEFANKIVKDPVVYTVQKEDLPLENVKQYYVECASKEDKYTALSNLYSSITIGQCMIFCHTKKTASWLAAEMTKDQHAVGLLSSELDIEQRAAIISRFRNGVERCLICTNVCARGIDIEQVTVVINFDMPVTVNRTPDYETYLHRIGRTGRFGKSGLAINFIDGPQSRHILHEIEKYFNMKVAPLDANDMEALEKIDQ